MRWHRWMWDALKEVDNEGNSSEGDGAKSGSVEDSENVDDDNRFTVYGTDGCLYDLSMKGKGKSAGKGDSGRGATFNGHCSVSRAFFIFDFYSLLFIIVIF